MGDDGRTFDVLGEPIDGGPPLDGVERRSIYQPIPSFTDQEAVSTPFATGIKVLDLLVPLPLGRKTGCSAAPASGRPSSSWT
jgi:F-type H+-transporting ATPase subunit beta